MIYIDQALDILYYLQAYNMGIMACNHYKKPMRMNAIYSINQ